MIEPVPLTKAQRTIMGEQRNNLKIEWKEGIQMSLCSMIGKNIKIYIQFLDYWKMHLWDSLILGMIWSLIPHVEHAPKICPQSAMESFYKKVPPCFFGGDIMLLLHWKIMWGIYSLNICKEVRTKTLRTNTLNLAKRIVWENRSVDWDII